MANANKTVVTLICERAADVNSIIDEQGKVTGVDDLHVIKLPCSGMVQPLMVEAALKAGAAGVIVCGCQIGDCYYREGNKMIRERLLGDRPPTLKKATDRRRILGLWLSRPQTGRFLSEAKTFVAYVQGLEAPPAAAPAPAAAAKAAPAKPATNKEGDAKAGEDTKAAAENKADAGAADKPKATPDATKPEGTVKETNDPISKGDPDPNKEGTSTAPKEEK
jgi:coenzyme F420-reducing hydrogenase delta subunit